MKQFLLTCDLSAGTPIKIHGKDYHYLRHVLRLKKGDLFMGRDREGRLYRLNVDSAAKDSLMLTAEAVEEVSNGSVYITLYQCLPKGRKMDQIVRQAAEVGVNYIVPVISENTVVTLEEGRENGKIERWNRIAREALQQSGARVQPQIEVPVALEHIGCQDSSVRLLFHPGGRQFEKLYDYLKYNPQSIDLLIGPEGGFTSTEIALLHENGFQQVSLGKTILKVETAALFALAAVKTLLKIEQFTQ